MALRRSTLVVLSTLLLGAMPLLTMNLQSFQPADQQASSPVIKLRRPLAAPVPAARLHAPTPPPPERPSPLPLGAEGASLVVDQLAVRHLAHGTDLQLTEGQWSDLAIITSYYQAVRQAHEASIAEVGRVSEGRFRVEVPPYPEVGDALREDFFAAVRGHLGGEAAGRVERHLGHGLEGHFGGFGISAQTLDFAGEPGMASPDYLVTRTITFWNRVGNQDRLSTRSEVHAPAVEDPTGRTWGPFLALLNRYGQTQSGS